MEQFTDKEIFEEFVKRFDLVKEDPERVPNSDMESEKISLRSFDGEYLGNVWFTFNKQGQFVDDEPSVIVDSPRDIFAEIEDMSYEGLVDVLGAVADALRSE